MADFTVRGTRPAKLEWAYYDDLKDVWDPDEALLHLMALPLFEPVSPTATPTIELDGEAVTAEEVRDLFQRALGENYNADAEAASMELLDRTLIHYTRSYRSRFFQAYACQAAASLGLPAADDYVIYSANEDVIPAARELLSKTAGPEKLLASISFAYEPETLGVWVRDRQVFDKFKGFCQVEAIRLSADISTDAKTAIGQLTQTNLGGLVTTLLLRNRQDPTPQNEPGTFARFLVAAMQAYAKQNPDEMGILPFHAGELVCPTVLTIIDVDAHAHASRGDVNSAWADVRDSLAKRPTILSQNQIANLSAATAALRQAQKKVEKASSASNRDAKAQLRNELAHMRTRPPEAVDLYRALRRQMNHMSFVSLSDNTAAFETKTWMRPNRRHPDDVTMPGKHTTVRYYPDICIFVDTSGSISEKHYASAVRTIIKTAKVLNVDVKVVFFSHVMSREISLRVKGRTASQIYASFRRAKKVTGGTDYEQIWNYVNSSAERRRRLNVVITDFEWQVPGRAGLHHPTNIFYYPVASESEWDWKCIVRCAKDFATDMFHIDPHIRRKILF